MEQKYTSKNTCINTVNMIYKKMPFIPGCRILDFGGGKYDTNTDFMKEKYNAHVYVYDKYNRDGRHNERVIAEMRQCAPDCIVCSNVLNVIMEDEVIDEILADIASFHAATIYISVYEGDKTGIGKETTKGWQRNQKACAYEDAIRKHFDIHCKNGTIFTLKEKQV